MSWREILGVASVSQLSAHNPQNTQKGFSADNADSAREETVSDSRLLEVLGSICRRLPITPAEVHQALAEEDIQAWRQGQISHETLAAFARLLAQRQAMDRGERPTHYNQHASCAGCGPVWLWSSGHVLACPWCRNRLAGKPIPRPVRVRCADCLHFQRIDHPRLGHCAQGQPEAVAGLWDESWRGCGFYLPA